MNAAARHDAPTVEEIEQARGRIAGAAIRTPLVRAEVDVPATEMVAVVSGGSIDASELASILTRGA